MRERFINVVRLLMNILGINDFDYVVNLVCNTDTGKAIIDCNILVLYELETQNVYSIIKESDKLISAFSGKLLKHEIVNEYLKSLGGI